MPDPAEKGLIPGGPSSQPPAFEEPTEPREPLTPKPDQSPPDTYSPTGQPIGAPLEARAQGGSYLTIAQGTRLPDTDHSQGRTAGPGAAAGPPRGSGAHGIFRGYGTAGQLTGAGVPAQALGRHRI